MKKSILFAVIVIAVFTINAEGVVLIVEKDAGDPLILGRASRYLSVYADQKMVVLKPAEVKYRPGFGEAVFIIGNSTEGAVSDLSRVIDMENVLSLNVKIFIPDSDDYAGEVFNNLTCPPLSLSRVNVFSIKCDSFTDINGVNNSDGLYWERILNKSMSEEFYNSLINPSVDALNKLYSELAGADKDMAVVAAGIADSAEFKKLINNVFNNENFKKYFININSTSNCISIYKKPT